MHGYLYIVESGCIKGLYEFSRCSWHISDAKFWGLVSILITPVLLYGLISALKMIKGRYTK